MKIYATKTFKLQFEKTQKKNPKLKLRIKKQLAILKDNPRHPSLKNHKLKEKQEDIWSISVGKNFRLLYLIKDGNYYLYDLGFHDQAYKS